MLPNVCADLRYNEKRGVQWRGKETYDRADRTIF